MGSPRRGRSIHSCGRIDAATYTAEQRHSILEELAQAYNDEPDAQRMIRLSWDDENFDENGLDELRGTLAICFVKSEGDWRGESDS